jgi:hypothetical protein
MKGVYAVIILTLLSGLALSCAKDNKNDLYTVAMTVTHVVGDVKITTASKGETIAAKASVKLAKDDIIITGKQSLAIIQIGDEAVLKIQEESLFKIAEVEKDKRAFVLSEGELIGKVKKLQKNDGFIIKTSTQVASVRGTDFRIKCEKKDVRISVKDGKVAVAQTEQLLSEAKIIDDGKTALVKTKDDGKIAVTLNAISKEEELAITSIAEVPMIPEADVKSEEELNKIMSGVSAENGSAPKEDKAKIAKQKEIIQKQKGSLAEIKEAFSRVDEITLYNKKVISGIIMTRGETYEIVTPGGKVSVKEKEIRNVRIIK